MKIFGNGIDGNGQGGKAQIQAGIAGINTALPGNASSAASLSALANAAVGMAVGAVVVAAVALFKKMRGGGEAEAAH